MNAGASKPIQPGHIVLGVLGAFAILLIGYAMHSDEPADPKPSSAIQTAAATPTTQRKAQVQSAPQNASQGDLDYLTFKAQAEGLLKAKLTDDEGVRYRGVETRLTTLDGDGVVAFCGELSSRTPLGGYGGFKRFIASRSVAVTEDGMSSHDFGQVWSQFCSSGALGPKVWF